jgi:hypothetical protein
MNFEKFLENLKHHARTLAIFDQQIEANVLDAIVAAIEDSLDNPPKSEYSGMDNDAPF